MADEELSLFALNLHADVLSRLSDGSIDDAGLTMGVFKEVVFTHHVLEALEEQGAVEDARTLYYEGQLHRRAVRITGYAVSGADDEDGLASIDLFTTIFTDSAEPKALERTAAREAIERARRFLEEMLQGTWSSLDASSEAYGLGKMIFDARGTLRKARVVLLTDGALKNKDVEIGKVDGVEIAAEVWDIERLCRSQASAAHPAEIDIDVRQELDRGNLPCLKVPSDSPDYQSYLCVIPGDLLYKLYERYGQRLLELNVRSFLSIAGKVNKGIRQTIRENPAHFFPFNNGLALTAVSVDTERAADGGLVITRIRGLQIVNGGQTTASIHRAKTVDNADLSLIHVQAKLNVINTHGDDDRYFDLVRHISLYANSQNKVNMVDLSANEPFHVELERIAKKTWAPGEQSQWFYERARGSFQSLKAKLATTPAQKKAFDRRYPASQRFTKTDLAKALNAWGLKPHVASLGGEKSFVHFMQSLGVRGIDPRLSVDFYKNLIGLLILYRHAEKIVRDLEIPAYRANVAAYLVAYVSWRTGKKVDLLEIWGKQNVTGGVASAMKIWAQPIYDALMASASGRNPSEWCKKEDCWKHISGLELGSGKDLGKLSGEGFEVVDTEGLKYVKIITEEVAASEWPEILRWVATTDKLTYLEKGVLNTLCGYALGGWTKQPSAKQAMIAVRALAKK